MRYPVCWRDGVPKARKWTPEQESEIARRYAAGESSIALAREFGTIATYVPVIVRRAGQQLKRFEKFPIHAEQEIAARYAAGQRSGALAKEYGCQMHTIRRIVQRHGVQTVGRGNQPKVFPDDVAQRIAELWRDGLSQTRIGAMFGMQQYRVSLLLRQAGVQPPERKAHWRTLLMRGDGRHINPYGYVEVLVPYDHPFAVMRKANGYIPEHRLVMAQKLGRPLTRGENVHHINGNQQDNRPANLELWIRSQPQGVRAKDVPHCLTCRCGEPAVRQEQ